MASLKSISGVHAKNQKHAFCKHYYRNLQTSFSLYSFPEFAQIIGSLVFAMQSDELLHYGRHFDLRFIHNIQQAVAVLTEHSRKQNSNTQHTSN